jgi:uncharacterized membrane protein YdjX (TVP38/TMEM64 family)
MRRRSVFYLSLLSLGAITVIGVLTFFLVAGWKDCSIFDVPSICLNLSMDEAVRFIQSTGGWGVAGAIGLMVIRTVIPFPAGILPVVNGTIYGLFWGAVITWIGAMLSAYLAFGLARLFGAPFVQGIMSEKQRERLRVWSMRTAALDLFAARLIPFISFNLINYAAGLMPVSLWTFSWTTGLGILPVMLLLVALGDRALVLPWWVWSSAAVGIVLAWFFLRRRFGGSSRQRTIFL